jgi:protein-disulfide isomerase
MDKLHKIVLLCLALCTTGLCAVVCVRLFRLRHPAPVLVSVNATEIIGRYPDFKGTTRGRFTLVIFEDFQCGACSRSRKDIGQLLARYPHNLRLTIRNFPLPNHPGAYTAAIAAESAKEQQSYWPMYEALFDMNGRTDTDSIEAAVRRLRLDINRFRKDSKAIAKQRVLEDLALAKRLQLDSTPYMFLCCPDGRVLRIDNLNQVDDVIRRA